MKLLVISSLDVNTLCESNTILSALRVQPMWDSLDECLESYLGGVCSGSCRLPDRAQTGSPSGCGWPYIGPPERHTPAAALFSRSTPSCCVLWLYILHAVATRGNTGAHLKKKKSQISLWCNLLSHMCVVRCAFFLFCLTWSSCFLA